MNQKPVHQRRRPRTPLAERSTWVQRFERSGLSQRAYAARHQLGLSTLQKWIARPPRSGSSPPLWQELKPPPTPTATRWVAELVRPDGRILRVAPDAPATWVVALQRGFSC